jgi:hypothetical protein
MNLFKKLSVVALISCFLLTPLLINQTVANAQVVVNKIDVNKIDVNKIDASKLKILENYKFNRSQSRMTIERPSQAAAEKAEDGDPTGPNSDISPSYLADRFEHVSPKYIKADFSAHIPFSDEIFRDHTSLNTYYFYPAGYLLKFDSGNGFDINFLHRSRVDEAEEELIVLTFTLAPRKLDGGMSLIRELAKYAIKPANDEVVVLRRLPISSVKVNMSGLGSLISEENIVIMNSPQKVGDSIRVQATMTQSQKEDVVASIRSGGLAGDIVFTTNNESFELVVPYFVSFTDFSGDWLSDISQLDTTDSVQNISPYPVLMKGVVVYAKATSGDKLKRHKIELSEPVVMGPGAKAKADKSFQQLVASYGDVVAAWPDIEPVGCDECINEVEREILVSPAQASRTSLPIEIIPNVFEQFSLFKVLVEVKSDLFSPNADTEQVQMFTLRSDVTQLETTLYVDRDASDAENSFSYRVKPFLLDGQPTSFSQWQSSEGIMDITITSGNIRPLVAQAPEPEEEPEDEQ